MRGTRTKAATPRAQRIERPRPGRPGPDTNPGIGREWARANARDNRRDFVNGTCITYLTGLRPRDPHLLDPQFDRIRLMGYTRILAHVHRLSADRGTRPTRETVDA